MTEDMDARWIAGEDIEVAGGIARPYKGSTMLYGYWHAIQGGEYVRDAFGLKMFGSPEEVEEALLG
jgi:hypothetical protein